MKKNYKYNLKDLEDKALEALETWNGEDNQQTRTVLFETINDLAYAVLRVGKYQKYNIDYDQVAYDYALSLFERLIVGSFVPKYDDRFPMQYYISKNILDIITKTKKDETWHDLISDMEYFIDNNTMLAYEVYEEEEDSEQVINKYNYAKTLRECLALFYTDEEVSRLLPLSLEVIFQSDARVIPKEIPEDLYDFSITLVSMAKRISRENNLSIGTGEVSLPEFKRAMSSSTRSTIFLSSIVNSDFFPKELLLTLDIDSLYRLVTVHGGKTIKIPHLRQLDTLLGASVAVSKAILEGKDADKMLKKAKDNYGLKYFNRCDIQSFVSKIMESYKLSNDTKETEPMINMLLLSTKSLKTLLDKMIEKADKRHHSIILDEYIALSKQVNNFTKNIMSMDDNNGK